MEAFEKGGTGGGGAFDMEDILNMFGMSAGGMGGMPGMGGGRERTKKGEPKVQAYEITLEELYKGKTTHFQSDKNVVCPVCDGSGGKDKAKPKTCDTCSGRGMQQRLRMVGAGLVTQEMVACSTCNGAGQFYKEKDRCKKCKGARVVEQKKMLELYIPPGSREDDKIVLAGEADQRPGQEPGDIIFVLQELPHDDFRRSGADLAADLKITLAEALTGFNRVVLTHLDGRGIQLNTMKPERRILSPGQVLKIEGEGMPVKKSEAKGDLYLEVNIEFPEEGDLQDEATVKTLQEILPKPNSPIEADVVDEVDYDTDADMEGFGAGYGEADGDWEDEDGQGAQCAQQ